MADSELWLFSGKRTPFCKVDGDLSDQDAIDLSLPVVQSMVDDAENGADLVIWGEVIPDLEYSSVARELWIDAEEDLSVPAVSTRMACSTSMAAVFDAVGYLDGEADLALCGGTESMSHVQIGLTRALSDWMRRLSESSGPGNALRTLAGFPLRGLGLDIPSVTNRSTGMSMGEHCEEMAREWEVPRSEQDEWALRSHRDAVAGQESGFFEDLIVEVDGIRRDSFPRPDTSREALGKLPPAFDPGEGTITAGNSSPLTDGAAGVWLATGPGRERFGGSHPRAKLVDWEVAAVDLFEEGLLMAPAHAIPRLLNRHDLQYGDVDLWEIHEAFAAQVSCHFRALESESFLRERVGVEPSFGEFPRDRVNPHGGSVALGHPFGATGARILSQAVHELAEASPGSRAVVSICANGGLGTVALLESV